MKPEILEMFRQHIESGFKTPRKAAIARAMGIPKGSVYLEFYKAAKLLMK